MFQGNGKLRALTTTVTAMNQAAITSNLYSDTTINLGADILLTSTILIGSWTGLVIDGMGLFKVDGQGSVQCFKIDGPDVDGAIEVTLQNLIITNGFAVSFRSTVRSNQIMNLRTVPARLPHIMAVNIYPKMKAQLTLFALWTLHSPPPLFRSLCERSPWWLFSWAAIVCKSSSFFTSITPRTPHLISAKPNTRRSCVNFAPSTHAPDHWLTPWRRFILRSTSVACPHIAPSKKSPKV
jgi:hypothetical protein